MQLIIAVQLVGFSLPSEKKILDLEIKQEDCGLRQYLLSIKQRLDRFLQSTQCMSPWEIAYAGQFIREPASVRYTQELMDPILASLMAPPHLICSTCSREPFNGGRIPSTPFMLGAT